MRKTTHRLLRYLLALGLSLSCAAILAVPRAAEHEDAEVTFGGAVGAPPKPAAKLATQPPNKGNKAAAAKTLGLARATLYARLNASEE